MSFEQVINHLEQSCRHLESLADPLIYELTEHDEVCCTQNKIISDSLLIVFTAYKMVVVL